MTTFIDTSVFCALPATDEDEHDAARAEFITVERLTHDILPAIDVEMVGADLHRQARGELVRARSRSVSFVDRVSFAFMRERGIRLALAIDDDFEAEGFEILPRPA